jgi:broad specificity phosphatase PhoE
MVRLTFVSSASTDAVRRSAFPLDEPLDQFGAGDAASLALPKPDRALTSPALRARQTAELLRLDATANTALRDLDYGRWAGRTMAEVEGNESDAVAVWMREPEAAPHGGESVATLHDRVREFLYGLSDGAVVAVTHPPVVRAAIIVALDAPLASFWKVDVAPLCRVVLHGQNNRWRLRSISG